MIDHFQKVQETRGIVECINTVKGVRTQLLHFLSEDGLFVKGIASTPKGWPKALGSE